MTVSVDPIPRIEGHLGIKLTVDAVTSRVTEANAHGNMFRGFENFLVGRDPNDAITFTQRICGVCPVPHGLASAYAVEAVYGYSTGHITFANTDPDGLGVPPKAVHVRNLILGAEFLMSSITHFYHLAAPSYVQGPNMPPWTPYFHDSYYHARLLSGGRALPDGSNLWSAVITQYVKALRMRRLTFEAGALFAGRMPMTSAYVAGGVTTQSRGADFRDRCRRFYNLMHEVGLFIVKEYVPLALALGALYPDYDNTHNGGQGIGAGLGNFLSWGAFPNPVGNTLALRGGYQIGVGAAPVVLVTEKTHASTGVANMLAAINENLIEDTARSWYVPDAKWGYPTGQSWQKPGSVTRTEPDRTKGVKYSWVKAPRWKVGGVYHAMEVGPLARMVVEGLYPVDGTLLSAKFVVPGHFSYADYFVSPEPITGPALDGRCIDIGLLNALVAEGLAGSVTTWIKNLKGGLSTMDRLRARALESLLLVQLILGPFDKTAANDAGKFGTGGGDAVPTSGWIGAVAAVADGESYVSKAVPVNLRSSYGATEAPRGSLSHHVSIDRGRIASYQCVVPTTWNASPKDTLGALRGAPLLEGRGAIEQAMIGSPHAGTAPGPGVEAMRIAQSFDPCIACAVH